WRSDCSARVWSRGERSGLLGPALVMALLVAVQVSLGASIIWTGRAVLPNTLHVPTGAALLAASLVLTLRAWHAAVRVRAVPAAVSAVAA
ncbi:MAG: hypothetical protein OEP45_15480, partial [Acidobacteriota bacterium]|nr:hypothetical protein [Acidobacteriota bacterium]